MVKGNLKHNKWMRRYRAFFVIGIVILFLQVFLAAKFISTNKTAESEENKWLPLSAEKEVDQDLEFNSARAKLENNYEEMSAVVHKTKTKSRTNQTHQSATKN
ncbi:hypothetical protein JTB14_015196 [Gonioctena quinquepunctata]|nr:hypothetical protein JTB14_015196 [Gonioctena quinquepunctata]